MIASKSLGSYPAKSAIKHGEEFLIAALVKISAGFLIMN
jgi:hypothetical protein